MDVQHIFHVEDQVFGSNQERIGTVVAVTPYYLHVTSGLLGFGSNYYIPYDAVKEAEVGMVVLKVPASRISELGWDQEPGEPVEAPHYGYYGTMPAPPLELAPLAPPPPIEAPVAPPSEPPHGPETARRATEAATQPIAQPAPKVDRMPANVCGHKLCDAHGMHLGTIRVASSDNLTVSTGFLGFGPTLHVPLGHVARCEGDCCYLDLTKDQVDEQEWKE